jgi:hypothetical protein
LTSYQTLNYVDPYHEWEPLDILSDGAGIAKDLHRWGVGLNYSPAPSFVFTVEYDFNREKTIELDNDVFLARASLLF